MEPTTSLCTITASTFKHSPSEYEPSTAQSSLRTQFEYSGTTPTRDLRSMAPQSVPIAISPPNTVLGQVSSRYEVNSSPILSSPNPGSGKLIAMFEELSRSKETVMEKKEAENTPPVTPEPRKSEVAEPSYTGSWSKNTIGRLAKYRDRLELDLAERRRSKSPSLSPKKDAGQNISSSPLKKEAEEMIVENL